MTYVIKPVKGDGTLDTFNPSFNVLSIGIYNNSNQQVMVTDASGNAYIAEPGSVRAQPSVPSGQYTIKAAGKVTEGQAFVDFSDAVRGFVFGGGEKDPRYAKLTPNSAVASLNSFTLLRSTGQLSIQVLAWPNIGNLTMTATLPNNGGVVKLLSNVKYYSLAGAINGAGPPIIINIDLPVGTLISSSSAVVGTATVQVGY